MLECLQNSVAESASSRWPNECPGPCRPAPGLNINQDTSLHCRNLWWCDTHCLTWRVQGCPILTTQIVLESLHPNVNRCMRPIPVSNSPSSYHHLMIALSINDRPWQTILISFSSCNFCCLSFWNSIQLWALKEVPSKLHHLIRWLSSRYRTAIDKKNDFVWYLTSVGICRS